MFSKAKGECHGDLVTVGESKTDPCVSKALQRKGFVVVSRRRRRAGASRPTRWAKTSSSMCCRSGRLVVPVEFGERARRVQGRA